MSRVLITGAMTTSVAAGASEFVFLPEGKRKIFPLSQKAGIEVHVPAERGESIAAALQADLDKRLRDNVEPWFDFEHTRKYPKSGYPKSFRYEKGVGIMCSAEWSRSGRIALRGKDVNHFSPEFYVDGNGVPNGLPDRGPVGGLVSEPAFRDLPAIAASAAESDPPDEPIAMSNLIFSALAITASASTAEADAVSKIEELKVTAARVPTLEKELAELKTKVTAAEDLAKKAAEKRAGDLVTAAIADGRIAAKDTDKADKFREKIAAGDAFAEEILTGLPKLNAGLDRPLIQAGQGSRQVAAGEGHAIEKKARELVTAGSAKNFDEGLEQVAASEPALYGDYLKTLTPAG